MTNRTDWPLLLKVVRDDAIIAQGVFESARLGKITPSMMVSEVVIPGGNTYKISGNEPGGESMLVDWARNAHMALLSKEMLMTDQALEARHGKKRLQDIDPKRRAVRCVVFQMRCAVAHYSDAPRWTVEKKYRLEFTIDGLRSGPLTMDFSQLNGQRFQPDSHSGGWYRVLELLDVAQTYL